MEIELEDLKNFLKDNLEVSVNISEEYGNDRTVRINVDLVLDGEVISRGFDYFTVKDS